MILFRKLIVSFSFICFISSNGISQDTIRTKYDDSSYFKEVSNPKVGVHFWYSPTNKFNPKNQDGFYIVKTPYPHRFDQGLIVNGKREGAWYRNLDSTGVICTYQYKNGKLHGSIRLEADSEHELQTIEYKKGKKHGESLTYFYTGIVRARIVYKRDKVKSSTRYNSNGIDTQIKEQK